MISIDLEKGVVIQEEGGGEKVTYPLDSPEAFDLVSQAWLRCGWDTKYVYSFTWFGRPFIQLPEDVLRLQEVIFTVKPDVIIETGVAHGGGLVFYASLCKLMDKGRVIGIDIEIRPHNRKAITEHPLYPWITLIEGSSVAPEVLEQVRSLIKPGESVMILLDSNHTKAHVAAELEVYAPLVSSGSYIVAMDGIMEQVAGAPRTQPDWTWNNPKSAVQEFLAQNSDFILEQPAFLFNEGVVSRPVTYWPDSYLKRK